MSVIKHFMSLSRRLHKQLSKIQILVKNVRSCSTASSLLSSPILCSDDHGVRRITLNNPKQRNVLSLQVLKNLHNFLVTIDEDSTRQCAIGCVVINAVGSVFSAGHDLKELTSASTKTEHRELFDLCAEIMIRINDLSVPVVAQVRGHAAAAGCQLAATCDILIASENASFSTPGINVGLFCSTPGVAIARALPPKIASYMLHTGLPITAKEAFTHGMVSRIVADDILEKETMRIASMICEKSLAAQKLGKRCLRRQTGLSIEEAYSEASRVMVDNLDLKDAQNGIDAFIRKKQPPKWSNS